MSDIKIQAPGLLTLLGVAFIVLKLCHVIAWSWWLVTLPFWGGLVLVIGLLILAGLFLGLSKR